jgi:hypothetical protein
VQTRVALDYQQSQQEDARQRYVDNLMDQYTITLESR